MKHALLIAVLLFACAAPAVAAEPSAVKTRSEARAERAALAELISARLKAALQGEAYVLDKSCDDTDCSISIRP
jgi:hypothetical protein